jgi:hypothetical protein
MAKEHFFRFQDFLQVLPPPETLQQPQLPASPTRP